MPFRCICLLVLLLALVLVVGNINVSFHCYAHGQSAAQQQQQERILHYPATTTNDDTDDHHGAGSSHTIKCVNATDLLSVVSHNIALVTGQLHDRFPPIDRYVDEKKKHDGGHALEPSLLWKHFAILSAIPRPPKQEHDAAQYVRDHLLNTVAKLTPSPADDDNESRNKHHHHHHHHKWYKYDEASGSMLFTIPAAPGFEHTPTIVIQGHLDMVCEVDSALKSDHNCSSDGITLLMTNGTWIHANRTSLGADNGIAVAMMLSLADELLLPHDDDDASSTSKDRSVLRKQHGKIELLFTVEEEIGLQGALRLSKDFYTGTIILNLDTMVPDQLTIGSAGGQDTNAQFTIAYVSDDELKSGVGSIVYDIVVSGLKGGHSGNEIHMGRANAIKLLTRLLWTIDRELLTRRVSSGARPSSYHISNIRGGTKRNAIPRDALATIHVQSRDDISIIEKLVAQFTELVNEVEYKGHERVKIDLVNRIGIPQAKPFASNFTRHVLSVLQALPSGPLSYSADFPVVSTSCNLAVVSTDISQENLRDNRLRLTLMTRSLSEGAKNETSTRIRSILQLAKATVIDDTSATYPSWTPRRDSMIARRARTVFDRLFDKNPTMLVSQSGLECAVVASKRRSQREEMEMLSMGPLIEQPHSPVERVHIGSVRDSYTFLKHLISDVAEYERI